MSSAHAHIVCTSSTNTYIICTSNAHTYVIHMSSAHAYIIGTLAAHCLQMHTLSTGIIHTLAQVAQFHAVLHLVWCACHPWTCMSYTCYLHIICMSSTHHLHIISRCVHHPHIICGSTRHFQQSLWTTIVFSVSKILIIDVTVVPDVVPDVVLLKIYCLHIIPGCPHGPHGSQLCFLSQR